MYPSDRSVKYGLNASTSPKSISFNIEKVIVDYYVTIYFVVWFKSI